MKTHILLLGTQIPIFIRLLLLLSLSDIRAQEHKEEKKLLSEGQNHKAFLKSTNRHSNLNGQLHNKFRRIYPTGILIKEFNADRLCRHH